MIDINCYLLAGKGGLAEAAESGRRAAAAGVKTIVAAQRWGADAGATAPRPFADYRLRLDRLRHELQGAVEVKGGFLLGYSARLPELAGLDGGHFALGGGRHLLVSLPPLVLPSDAAETWRALRGQGLAAVLARPECSPALRRQPGVLERWVGEGVALQLDAASVTGAHGRDVMGFALRCAQAYAGRVAVASNGRGWGARAPEAAAVRAALAKALGVSGAERLLEGGAATLFGDGGEVKAFGRAPSARPRSLWHSLGAGRMLNGWFS